MNNSIGKSSLSLEALLRNPLSPEEEKILYYTGASRRAPAVNVGTVGHIDWGRHGYQPDLNQLLSNIPYLEARSVYDVYLSQEEINELWGAYVRVTETPQNGYVQVKQGVSSDYAIAKGALVMSKKRGQPYLGFDNGGLVVAGKVIWILADKEYKRFHTKAASWVLPSKEYVKAVVAHYFWRQVNDPVIARVQGNDIRKSDVANGWGAYAGKLMIPEYTRNADGSYLIDDQGNKVPTGREVEGIKINVNELFKQEALK
jgi:hypothetical protein